MTWTAAVQIMMTTWSMEPVQASRNVCWVECKTTSFAALTYGPHPHPPPSTLLTLTLHYNHSNKSRYGTSLGRSSFSNVALYTKFLLWSTEEEWTRYFAYWPVLCAHYIGNPTATSDYVTADNNKHNVLWHFPFFAIQSTSRFASLCFASCPSPSSSPSTTTTNKSV